MFEKVMAKKLEGIFGIEKVTYDKPSQSNEQYGLFVDVQKCTSKVKDTRQTARAEGVITIFAPGDKLPFGYFSKRIDAAPLELTRGFFFGTEENVGVIKNIAERRFDFTFLFDSQYDPDLGRITSVNTSISET